MRILFDSKQLMYKDPFGTLVPGQKCTLNIHIPVSVGTTAVTCILKYDDGTTTAQDISLLLKERKGPYEIWSGEFSIPDTGLYFYYFYISKKEGGFRLFKAGEDTNMEAGDLWQVS